MYDRIKEALISRYSISVERSINQLISNEEMGDKTPSEFFRYLKQLAGPSANLGENLIKKIWAGRLQHLVNIAVIQNRDLSHSGIVDMADKVYEAMQIQSISGINNTPTSGNPPSTDRIFVLENDIL